MHDRSNTPRLEVRKTYKLFIGGNFVRSESGRVLPALSPTGTHLDNAACASRKDLRDAVSAARKAFDGWSRKTAYLRGQILYRAAEMLESRTGDLTSEVSRSTGTTRTRARREVALCVDRLVYFAGWSDKYSQVFSTVNPVATPHFNFTLPEPTGVVVVLAPDTPALLPLVSLLASTLVSGNAVIGLASDRYPLPALTLAEILATSDLPPGAVNLLAGRREELASHIASHMDVNAILDATGDAGLAARLQAGTAANLKRYTDQSLTPDQWTSAAAEDPRRILAATEFKTAWHPIGL